MGNRVKRIRTDVSGPQMAQAIIMAWKDLFQTQPTKEQVNMILAQNSLETGNRKSMWNYNIGNITTDGNGPYDYFDDLTTDEQIAPGTWKKMNLKYRAYPSLEEGAKDYLKLLSGPHYASAWQHILHPDPVAFSKALKSGGYYTANESSYTKALTGLYNNINKSDSYDQALAGNVNNPPQNTLSKAPENLDQILNDYVGLLSAASLKKLYNKTLPNHDILIQINASDHTNAVEFSRILCMALDEELQSTAFIYSDGHKVEIECRIAGPSLICLQAVEQLTQSVAEVFKFATKKIGGISINCICNMNKKSSYQEINIKIANANYRKFLLKLM